MLVAVVHWRLMVFAVAVLLPITALPGPSRDASALPPLETDVLTATGQVNIESRLGSETIDLSGTVTIERGATFQDGGVDVIPVEIVDMSLSGSSLLGPIAVAENSNLGSLGEIRGLQPSPQFPASSFLDVFAFIGVPAAPAGSKQLANAPAIHMTAQTNVTEWPPQQIKYVSEPLRGVDNDGDGPVDEDTSDEDGDHLYDEDPIDGINNDTDGSLDEDPPIAQCSLALCDADGDTLIDEDPDCVPLFSRPPVTVSVAGACIVSISLTVFADADKDGCSNVRESETSPGSQVFGGLRDPNKFWDFFDTPNLANGRDRAITVVDIFNIVERFGSTGNPLIDPLSVPPFAPDYHTAFDRSPPDPGGAEWNLQAADGVIAVGDIFSAVAQFGHTCV